MPGNTCPRISDYSLSEIVLSLSSSPKREVTGSPVMSHGLFLIQFFLAGNGKSGERHGFESHFRNRFSGNFAHAVGAVFDALKSLVDLVESVLLLRKEVQRKIAIVGITTRIGLVHTEGGF